MSSNTLGWTLIYGQSVVSVWEALPLVSDISSSCANTFACWTNYQTLFSPTCISLGHWGIWWSLGLPGLLWHLLHHQLPPGSWRPVVAEAHPGPEQTPGLVHCQRWLTCWFEAFWTGEVTDWTGRNTKMNFKVCEHTKGQAHTQHWPGNEERESHSPKLIDISFSLFYQSLLFALWVLSTLWWMF